MDKGLGECPGRSIQIQDLLPPPISPSLQAGVQEEAGWERMSRRGVALSVKPQGSGVPGRQGGPLSGLLDPRESGQKKEFRVLSGEAVGLSHSRTSEGTAA